MKPGSIAALGIASSTTIVDVALHYFAACQSSLHVLAVCVQVLNLRPRTFCSQSRM